MMVACGLRLLGALKAHEVLDDRIATLDRGVEVILDDPNHRLGRLRLIGVELIVVVDIHVDPRSARTDSGLFSTRETVAGDTPARRATSPMVGTVTRNLSRSS